MDDEQQGAWWTTPPRDPARPGTRRAGPPDDGIEVSSGSGSGEGPAPEPDAEPSLFIPMPATGQVPVVRPPVIRPPAQPGAQQPLPPPLQASTLRPPSATSRVDVDPPTRPVEYLTVRLDPEPAYRRSGDTMEVPAAAMPRLRQASPEDGSAPQPAFRRGPAIVLGVGVLVVIIVVAVVASIVATGVDADRDRNTAGDRPATAADLVGGTPPANLTRISSTKATSLLIRAAARPAGEIKQSFTWDDKNGKNLLVTASEATGSGTTLSVVHVAGLAGKPRILRTMVDPNLPECSGGTPRAAFTAGSIFVRDIDGDGTAEATIGWASRCSDGDQARSVAKLALISNGRKFIIRGEGVIGGLGSSTPDPVATDWPTGFRSPAAKLYRTLYF